MEWALRLTPFQSFRDRVNDSVPAAGVFAIVPWVWGAVVFLIGLLALAVRRGKLWWTEWCFSLLFLWLFLILFIIFFIIFRPFADFCTVLPNTDGGATNWQEVATDSNLRVPNRRSSKLLTRPRASVSIV